MSYDSKYIILTFNSTALEIRELNADLGKILFFSTEPL